MFPIEKLLFFMLLDCSRISAWLVDCKTQTELSKAVKCPS